jgi:hypothetical protein
MLKLMSISLNKSLKSFNMSPATNAMVLNTHVLDHDDRSLQFLENLNKSSKPQAYILRQLVRYHERHEDLRWLFHIIVL